MWASSDRGASLGYAAHPRQMPQEYNSPRFRRCDECCAFGIATLLYIDKGVPVAHRPTKRSPGRHFRCGLVRNECGKSRMLRSIADVKDVIFYVFLKPTLNKYAIYKHDKHLGWGAVSDLSLILDLSQKFKHGLWRLKSKLKLSQKQHLTPGLPK